MSRIKPVHHVGHQSPERDAQLYAILLDAIPSSVLLIDTSMRIVSANRNFLERGQRTIDNTIGYRLEEVFPAVILDQMDMVKRIRQVMERNEPVRGERMTYRAPGVPIRIYYYSLLPFTRLGQVEGAVLLMDDVTEQVRLSEEVRRVERHLASIVDSASDLILSMDRKGRILTWNTAAEKLTGHDATEVRERNFAEFCAEEDQREIREIISGIERQEHARMKEFSLKTRQATFLPVSWVFSPLKDNYHQTVGIVAVGRDLMERRKFELELHQSQKLASLGVMAGGIAHEIRNPLAICSSAAQFLMEDDVSVDFRRECVGKITQGIQRASTIIENLLKFSHPSATNRKTLVSLVPLIKETLTLVTHHAQIQKIDIQASFSQETVMVRGMATLLQQVFMNLFLNAINAMTDGGRLTVALSVNHADVSIRISDTGCGISPGEMEKIFDPFYTTSAVGRGTGLGLSLCYSIVKQHHGVIAVESVSGKGSAFTVKLPMGREGGEP